MPAESESESESPVDRLWQGYSQIFREFDDLTLARWMSQTLSQLEGRVWRMSHPLLGAYRLAAQVSHDRQIWLKRLASIPAAYSEAPCCRAALLPLITRDFGNVGLICQHCGETVVEKDDLPAEIREALQKWGDAYAPVHAVAHWDDRQRKSAGNYDRALEDAALAAEKLLAQVGSELCPMLLNQFPAAVWEDQDECLEVRPEDIVMSRDS